MSLTVDAINPEEVRDLAAKFEGMPLTDVLRWTWDNYGEGAAIGTSFQGAGLVMIHHAVKAGLPFPIFTLDTQLLFPETLELKDRLEKFFGVEIESLYPEQTPEEQTVSEGPELWKTKPRRLHSETTFCMSACSEPCSAI